MNRSVQLSCMLFPVIVPVSVMNMSCLSSASHAATRVTVPGVYLKLANGSFAPAAFPAPAPDAVAPSTYAPPTQCVPSSIPFTVQPLKSDEPFSGLLMSKYS